jgi:hypothetical protein
MAGGVLVVDTSESRFLLARHRRCTQEKCLSGMVQTLLNKPDGQKISIFSFQYMRQNSGNFKA